MSISYDDPYLDTVLGGTDKMINTGTYGINVLVLKAKNVYEGTEQECARCIEESRYFVSNLIGSVPKYLCKFHTENWLAKRSKESLQTFIKVYVIYLGLEGTIYLYKIGDLLDKYGHLPKVMPQIPKYINAGDGFTYMLPEDHEDIEIEKVMLERSLSDMSILSQSPRRTSSSGSMQSLTPIGTSSTGSMQSLTPRSDAGPA